MSDRTPESDASAADAESTAPSLQPSHDWFLAQLVMIANRFQVEVPLTLTVGGATITGLLIGGKKYFEELASTVLAGTSSGAGEPIKQALADIISNHAAIYREMEAAPPEEIAPPGYIHLQNAQWVTGSGQYIPSDRGVLWRARLSAVDSFYIGRLNRGPAVH